MTEPLKLPQKPYVGFVWIGDEAGIRISLSAATSTEAVLLVKAQYGEDSVVSLWNEEDAARER